MANTYTQIHIHAVFAVQNRISLIQKQWQEGYGAFSYGKSQIDNVVKYIQQQEQHHTKHDFAEEFLTLLQSFDVAYNERYVLKNPQ